jgi:SAM-dependent methyltransferase
MELLIGSGYNHKKKLSCNERDDWAKLVTLDINPDCKPDVLWDLTKLPLPFDDNTFDEIHASQVLEHVGQQGDWRFWLNQWADFWRILKPDGMFFADCPHYTSPWCWGDPGHSRAITLESLIFLDQTEYAKQVGVTPMTDYRPYYRADFRPLFQQTVAGEIRFVVQAVKPARLLDHSG